MTAAEYLESYANSDAVRNMSEYRCPKCDHHRRITGEIRAPGDAVSSAFDVATEKFSYVSCNACGYTEFYRKHASIGSTTMDLLIG